MSYNCCHVFPGAQADSCSDTVAGGGASAGGAGALHGWHELRSRGSAGGALLLPLVAHPTADTQSGTPVQSCLASCHPLQLGLAPALLNQAIYLEHAWLTFSWLQPSSPEALAYTALVAETAATFHAAIPGSQVSSKENLNLLGNCLLFFYHRISIRSSDLIRSRQKPLCLRDFCTQFPAIPGAFDS